MKEIIKFDYVVSDDQHGAVMNYLNEKHTLNLEERETILTFDGKVFAEKAEPKSAEEMIEPNPILMKANDYRVDFRIISEDVYQKYISTINQNK